MRMTLKSKLAKAITRMSALDRARCDLRPEWGMSEIKVLREYCRAPYRQDPNPRHRQRHSVINIDAGKSAP